MSKLTWVKWLIYASAAFTLGMLAFIVGFIVWNGLGALTPSLFAWDYTTDNLSLTPALISTLITVGLSLAIATPIGVFTGFYLVEYADRKSRVVKVIRLATDTLAAVPSIVYGLFGMLFFVIYLRFQFSLLAGILTIVIMVLPIIISATEEGLLQVDNSLPSCKGSFWPLGGLSGKRLPCSLLWGRRPACHPASCPVLGPCPYTCTCSRQKGFTLRKPTRPGPSLFS